MSRSESARLERHLRRLDAGTCAALVADLWAARGFETRREGPLVTATRRGTTTTFHAVTGVRAGSAPDAAVDVVVAPDGGRAGRRVAAATGADLFGAADLSRALRYAVDPATADAICERHLGAPPADLRPPLPTRAWRGLGAVSGGAAPAVLAAILLVFAGVAFAAPFVGTAGDAPSPPAGATEAVGAASGVDASGGNASGPAAVPGLGARRIADVDALAAAHDRGLERQSYTLRYDYHGPRGWGAGRGPIHRRTEATVAGERFDLVTTVTARGTVVETKRVYHDGEGWYVSDGGDYRYIPDRGGAPSMENDPGELRRILVYRYLSTPSSTVVGPVVRDGETLYRVVGRGRPEGMPYVDALNYTVRAHVDRNGVVRDLTARYALATDDGRAAVTVAVRHDRLGETTVTPPDGIGGADDGREAGDGDERLD